MARTDTLANYITDISNAVREVTGETGTIKANELDTKIRGISGGGKYAPKKICFYNYTGTELDEELANLDVSNITDMSYMFSNCSNVTHLDLSNFDTTNVTSMIYMFNRCSSLTSLDLSSFYIPNITTTARMFANCTSLQFLDIRNFDFTGMIADTSTFENVPANCEIIVKDEDTKTWINTWFVKLTNVKTVAEYEGA